MILPLSYRTKKQIEKYEIDIPSNVIIEEPIAYAEFISLLINSYGVLTDSGTVIEEACILGIPSVQMRKSTERPEVYNLNSSVKFDPGVESDLNEVLEKLEVIRCNEWDQPFGDGLASERIFSGIVDFEENAPRIRIPDLQKANVRNAYRSRD